MALEGWRTSEMNSMLAEPFHLADLTSANVLSA